jgi:hypothetical protein
MALVIHPQLSFLPGDFSIFSLSVNNIQKKWDFVSFIDATPKLLPLHCQGDDGWVPSGFGHCVALQHQYVHMVGFLKILLYTMLDVHLLQLLKGDQNLSYV